jgi:hypothetical protein
MLLPLLAAAAAPVDTHILFKEGGKQTIKIYRYIYMCTDTLAAFIYSLKLLTSLLIFITQKERETRVQLFIF